jgi:catechol 2,3-dioxygenase-like lactoylglutathione lyase family enzyme
MEITGISHAALTVTDLDRSMKWYADVLGWSRVFDGEADSQRFAFGFIGSGVGLALRQHLESKGGAFTPDTTGLDHLAFAVGARDHLAAWEKKFDELGVSYTPTIDEGYGHVLNFKDPDNIALEVFAPAGS